MEILHRINILIGTSSSLLIVVIQSDDYQEQLRSRFRKEFDYKNKNCVSFCFLVPTIDYIFLCCASYANVI